jgi:hypothetical protein
MSASVGFRSESMSVPTTNNILIVLPDLAVPQRIFLSRPSKPIRAPLGFQRAHGARQYRLHQKLGPRSN